MLLQSPTPIETTMDVLPRFPEDCKSINIHLKRKISNEHSYIAQQINPAKVYRTLLNLLDQPLYRTLGIKANKKWEDLVTKMSHLECPFRHGSASTNQR